MKRYANKAIDVLSHDIHSPNNCDEQKGGLAYLLLSAYLVLKAENDTEKAIPATKIYLLKNTV